VLARNPATVRHLCSPARRLRKVAAFADLGPAAFADIGPGRPCVLNRAGTALGLGTAAVEILAPAGSRLAGDLTFASLDWLVLCSLVLSADICQSSCCLRACQQGRSRPNWGDLEAAGPEELE
jgi:hypothetical protein